MRIKTFIANEPDGEHCLQADYRMVVEALTGTPVSKTEAESETGYVAGRDTWQFEALLGFARRGLLVLDCENFDPSLFVDDPAASVTKQVGDENVASKILAETNIQKETQAVRECLAHPNVSFSSDRPTLDSLREQLEGGAMLIVNINSKRLRGEPGHRGHSVIVESIGEDFVTIQNPGFPEMRDEVVKREDFEAAWADPSPDMANFISVRKLSTP